VSSGTGTNTGDPLSNDNALYIGLRQTYAAAKHNGGFYIAGQSQATCEGSTWSTSYLSGAVTDFTSLLDGYFHAVTPEVGKWEMVVLSKTIVPWTTGIGTPSVVTSAVANNRVMTQSRRRQKVKGFS